MPMGPQMLEDVQEPMPARSATLRDLGTPYQIVMEQDINHHIENSRKSTQLCVNFSSTTGTRVTRSSADHVLPRGR